MQRRALLSTAVAGLAMLARCGADGGPDTADSSEQRPPHGQTPDTGTPALNTRDTPDADKQITIDNTDEEAHAVTLTVTPKTTGTVVQEGTYDLSVDGVWVPYDLRAADPDGVEPFDVDVTLDGGSDNGGLTLRTSKCHGAPTFITNENGRLRTRFAIC